MKKEETKPENRSEAQRINDYKRVLRETKGDHRAAVRSYVQGNKWATENAKAVGNI